MLPILGIAYCRSKTGLRRVQLMIWIGATVTWLAFSMVLLGPSLPPTLGFGVEGVVKGLPASQIAHLILFVPLGFLASIGVLSARRSPTPLSVLLAGFLAGSLWGLTTELYQTTVPSRDGSLVDVLLDSIGSFTGALIVALPWGLVSKYGSMVGQGQFRRNSVVNFVDLAKSKLNSWYLIICETPVGLLAQRALCKGC